MAHLTHYFDHTGTGYQGVHEITRSAVMDWMGDRLSNGTGAASVNQGLSAIKRLVSELDARGLIGRVEAQAILGLHGIKQHGVRLGNWLGAEDAKRLIDSGENERDRALLAVLIGCGLRREEAAGLQWEQLQLRADRWVWVDIIGKKRRVRSVGVPGWVMERVERLRVERLRYDGHIERVGNIPGSGMQLLASAEPTASKYDVLRVNRQAVGDVEARGAGTAPDVSGVCGGSGDEQDNGRYGREGTGGIAYAAMHLHSGNLAHSDVPRGVSTGQLLHPSGQPLADHVQAPCESGAEIGTTGRDEECRGDMPQVHGVAGGQASDAEADNGNGSGGSGTGRLGEAVYSQSGWGSNGQADEPHAKLSGHSEKAQEGKVAWLPGPVFNLTASGIWYLVTRYSTHLGLRVSPHDLRRTYAQLCEDGGAELRQIQAELGHASIQTTERYLGQSRGLRQGKSAGDHIRL